MKLLKPTPVQNKCTGEQDHKICMFIGGVNKLLKTRQNTESNLCATTYKFCAEQ